jgi:NADH:ubiquinone oxidoreductase subunit 6 (subunit J)
MLLKKTNGQKSHSLTMAWTAFALVALWLLLGIFQTIGPVSIRAFDGAAATLFLFPVLGNYFGGKFLARGVSHEAPGAEDAK